MEPSNRDLVRPGVLLRADIFSAVDSQQVSIEPIGARTGELYEAGRDVFRRGEPIMWVLGESLFDQRRCFWNGA